MNCNTVIIIHGSPGCRDTLTEHHIQDTHNFFLDVSGKVIFNDPNINLVADRHTQFVFKYLTIFCLPRLDGLPEFIITKRARRLKGFIVRIILQILVERRKNGIHDFSPLILNIRMIQIMDHFRDTLPHFLITEFCETVTHRIECVIDIRDDTIVIRAVPCIDGQNLTDTL